MKPLSRRDFLIAGGTLALGTVAASCAKKKTPLIRPGATLDEIIGARTQNLEVIAVGTELLPARAERFAVGLAGPADHLPIPNMTGRMWFATTRTQPAQGPFPITYHGDGLGDRGVYESRITFPSAGQYIVFIEATRAGSTTPLAGGAQVQVGVQNAMPKPGDRAIVVPTPTVDDARGVHPICTRKPPCSMHQISLDDALKNGKPTVVIIATPAFCQSRLCGPEVDIVQGVSQETGAKANFIHIEVYRDDKADTITKQILSPAAEAWKLDQEPAIYYIDKAGIIADRQLGPVDRADVRDAMRALVS